MPAIVKKWIQSGKEYNQTLQRYIKNMKLAFFLQQQLSFYFSLPSTANLIVSCLIYIPPFSIISIAIASIISSTPFAVLALVSLNLIYIRLSVPL